MSRWVLDASALLALLNREPGHGLVADALAEGAMMSTVNFSEVVAKLADAGLSESEVREAIEPLGIDYAAFDEEGALFARHVAPSEQGVRTFAGRPGVRRPWKLKRLARSHSRPGMECPGPGLGRGDRHTPVTEYDRRRGARRGQGELAAAALLLVVYGSCPPSRKGFSRRKSGAGYRR